MVTFGGMVRLATVGLVAGLLMATSSGGTATAAAVPCVQTFSAPFQGPPIGGGSGRPVNVEVPASASTPDSAVVADVNVAIQLDSGGRVELEVWHGFSEGAILTEFSDDTFDPISLTFDDEAAAPRHAGQAGGTVRPTMPLARYDGDPVTTTGRAAWQVIVMNPQGGSDVRPLSATFTFTLASCDSDGDGIEEKVDNCPAVANADQANWDGDAQGNACDATPGTAPVTPTPTPTVSPTTQPTQPPACTTDCAYERTVGMRLKTKRHRFAGKVESPAVGCVADVNVTIWKKLPGRDRKLLVVTSLRTGKFATKAPRRPGRFYARVGSAAEPLCAADKSRVVRVRRH